MTKTLAALLVGTAVAFTAARAEPDGFETTLSLGVTLNQGNTDSSLGNASLLSERKTDLRTIRAGIDFVYGEQDGEKSAENLRGFAGIKETLRDRLYATADLLAMADPIADVDYRAIVSAGLGVYLMKDDVVTLTVDAGPAYIWEKVGGVSDDFWGLRAAQRYDRALSETAKVWQSLEFVPEAEDFDNYLLIGEIGVEAALNSRLSLRTVFKVTYDNEPAPGARKADRQLLAGLVIRL